VELVQRRPLTGIRLQAAKYLAVLRVSLLTRWTYRTDVLLRSVFLVVVMFVFSQLWRTTYSATGASVIGSFSLVQMMWYLAVTESILLAQPRVTVAVDEEVKSGQLAYTLNRPFSYVLFHYAQFLGEAAVRLPINLVISGAVAWLTVGVPDLDALALPPFALLLLGGFTIHFLISMSVALLAFWVEDTGSIYLLYSRLVMLLGGVLLPLDIFPTWLRRIAGALPTQLICYRPALFFVQGRVAFPQLGSTLMALVLWMTGLAVLTRMVYRAGVKCVNVQGG